MFKRNKNILLMISGLVGFILTLIMFIQSKEVYKDEYGTDISFNEDYLILMIVTFSFFFYAFFCLKADKQNERHVQADIAFFLVTTALLSLYPLGVFFKALFKALNKSKEFAFMYYEKYLFFGIFFLCLLIYFIYIAIVYRKDYKKKQAETNQENVETK